MPVSTNANCDVPVDLFGGDWNASTGAYPVDPKPGALYRVVGAGTVSGIAYSVGEHIYYDNTGERWNVIPIGGGGGGGTDVSWGMILGDVSNQTDIFNLVSSKASDTTVVHKTGNESVAGVKTFTSFPVTPSSAPLTDYQVSNKKYADDLVALKANTTTEIQAGTGLTGGGTLAANRQLSVDFATTWKGTSLALAVNQKTLYDAINSCKDYSAIYVDAVLGDNTTGNGTMANPYATITKALNPTGSAPISSRTIYVKSSTTENIVFESLNTSIQFILDPKSQHSGNITFVNGNTSIYFVSNSGTALLSGVITDGSQGNIYFNCLVTGTYNKIGGSVTATPAGYVEFGVNSNVDGLALTLTGNTTVRTLGAGAMGQLTQSNGILAAQHKGSIYSPIVTSAASPANGQPLCLLQGQIQLLANGSNKSLSCSATYGIVYISGISTLQNDFATFGKIDFTGAGVNCFSFVWVDSQLATAGDVAPLTGFQLVNNADYLGANYTPTNYTPTNASVKGHLSGINTKLGTTQATITASNGVQKVANNIQGVDATTSIKGVVQLSNSYAGTSQVLATTEKALSDGLALKAAQATTYTKAEADTLLLAKEDKTNKATSTALGTSDTLYPTQNAVKTYVDTGLSSKLNTSLKGAINGLAELDAGGKVPSTQLPAYVDDVLEFADLASFPVTGESGKIYIALDTNLTYRWGGSVYVVIASSLALGETSSTAYRGDRGKTAHDHSQLTTGNPHNVTKSEVGLSNVDNTSDANKPISSATQTALNAKISTTAINQANGVVGLDGTLGAVITDGTKTATIRKNNAQVPSGIELVLPAAGSTLIGDADLASTLGGYYTKTASDGKFQDLVIKVANEAAMLALTGIKVGYVVARIDLANSLYRLNALPASTIGNWETLGGSAANWGGITGTLSSQTDLQSALNAKQNTITGAASSAVGSDFGINKVVVTEANGKLDYSNIGRSELNNLSGLSSNVQTQLDAKAPQATTYTKTEADTLLSAKQATLVSGTNIKSVNGSSILGAGDVTISGVASQKILFAHASGARTYADFTLGGIRWTLSQTASTNGSQITLFVKDPVANTNINFGYCGVIAYYLNGSWTDTIRPASNIRSPTSGSLFAGVYYDNALANATAINYTLIPLIESSNPAGTAGRQFQVTMQLNVNSNLSSVFTIALLGG